MEWDEGTIVRLRELWSEGLSTAEIGRRLGVSKNAIVGKAHRLELPPRPSPIRRDPAAQENAASGSAPRAETTTLPPLPSDQAPKQAPVIKEVPPPVSLVVVPPPAPVPAARPVSPAPRPVPPSSHRPYARIVTCCWPIGEPGTSGFHFCDDPSEPGKPYCAEHAKLAYVKVRDRREDAA
jgi:GcrA cell cycle regulator